MRAFVAFARAPTDATWRKLAFARTVDVGLGRRLVLQRSPTELRDPEAWKIHVKYFRAYGGPFSALRLMAEERGPLQVSVGPHAHCASPPVPPPRRVETLRRVSVQPQLPKVESCLQWWTVDVYVDEIGEVHAVTLDAWEP
jgi:hypothetical protein